MASPETIAQILNAAGQVFAENGFHQATVREICAIADVNLAAVNYHFGDKKRLYIEAVKSARQTLEAAVPLPANLDTAEPEVALRVFIQTLARRFLLHDGQWRHTLLIREFMNPSQACEEMMQESIRPTLDRLQAIILSNLSSDVPEHTIRQLAFSIISQCAYYRLQERVVVMLTPADEYETHFTPDVLADHITRFSLAAIRSYEFIDIHCSVQESR